MKNALATLILPVIFCGYLSAQDIHQPSPMTFSQPHLVDTGQQAKFFYSWNWINGPRTLNLRYKTNAFHTLETFNNTWSLPQASNLDLLLLPDSINYLWKPWNVHDGYQPLDAMAIMWLPWLPAITDNSFRRFLNDKTDSSMPLFPR